MYEEEWSKYIHIFIASTKTNKNEICWKQNQLKKKNVITIYTINLIIYICRIIMDITLKFGVQEENRGM